MAKEPRDISAIMNCISWAEKIVDRKLPQLEADDPGCTDRQWLREAAFGFALKELITGKYTMNPSEFDLLCAGAAGRTASSATPVIPARESTGADPASTETVLTAADVTTAAGGTAEAGQSPENREEATAVCR